MTETQIKTHEMDQTICFDGDKSHDNDVVHSENIQSRVGAGSSKIGQENLAQKPNRKRRRLLAGW